jgi:excinuclease UvrABC helicase subunit UvrB
VKKLVAQKRRQMHEAADALDFETAALLRDEISKLEIEINAEKKSVKKSGKKS